MEKIRIHEVGMRDGLQIEDKIVPLEKKAEWTIRLAESGLRAIQVGSFVHPAKVPQMADTDELVHLLKKENVLAQGACLTGLVFNEKGLERALDCGIDMICTGVSASEEHSTKNSGKSIAGALKTVLHTAHRGQEMGKPVQLSVQCAFGYRERTDVEEVTVQHIIRDYVNEGFTRISLADTTGLATPFEVELIFQKLSRLYPRVRWACHFHDARGFGLANCYAAMQNGVSEIECSFGGLGGCPFTDNSSGNVSTEELVNMLPPDRLAEKIDAAGIASVSAQAEQFFGKSLPGFFYKRMREPS